MRLIRAALGELSDLELAYFATYTAPKLAPVTQRKIFLYVAERKLNKTKIQALIELNESKKHKETLHHCSSCAPEATHNTRETTQRNIAWVTYAELLNRNTRPSPTHWQVHPSKCRSCNKPIHDSRAPRPSVSGVRVFNNLLRS